MNDADFWKKQYQDAWGQSADREENIRRMIQQQTGVELQIKGLGAGTAEFISGSAASHGLRKGDADFTVKGHPIGIEITGPLVTSIREDNDLWIRPDKIANAREALPRVTILVHHLPRTNLLRVIFFNDRFYTAFDKGDFQTVHPRIRGVAETYVSIPAGHVVVRPWIDLVNYLKQQCQ